MQHFQQQHDYHAGSQSLIITVKHELSPEEVVELSRFRLDVYAHQGIIVPAYELDEQGRFSDSLDWSPKAVHILVHQNGQLVASARVSVHDSLLEFPDAHTFMNDNGKYEGPYATLNRLVIDPQVRGHKLAAYLTELRIELAQQLGAKTVFGCALGAKRRQYFETIGFQCTEHVQYDGWGDRDTWFFKVVKCV